MRVDATPLEHDELPRLVIHPHEVERLDRLANVLDAASTAPEGLLALLTRTPTYRMRPRVEERGAGLDRLAALIDRTAMHGINFVDLLSSTPAFQALSG